MKRIFTVLFIAAVLSNTFIMAQIKYQPTWESIDSRPTPEWFRDAKFGVFVCWGLYSVPAWSPKGKYAEWYQYWLREKSFNGEVYDFHVKNYGEDFKFWDFTPMFRAELWDPDEWSELFRKAGAKYIVFTTKHHSGYCMWPSTEASNSYGYPWNCMEAGPGRDIVGELTQAIRNAGLKMGLYYSLYEWYHPLWLTDRNKFVNEHFFPQFKDLITRYHPDIVWTDGEWSMTSDVWKTPEILAWLFNNSPNIDELVINDRWGSDCRHKHGGFYTTEYGSGLDNDTHPWEENRGMAYSYGYNRAENLEDYRSPQELILMLVDIVSRGGNLCLDVGPNHDGTIPLIMQERLLQIGKWLDINGEAIYDTKTWKVNCQWSEGEIPEMKRSEYMSGFDILKITLNPEEGKAVKEIFYTWKNNNLYAITPQWPGKKLIIKGIEANTRTRVTFLETGEDLSWTEKENQLIIQLPDFNSDKIKSQYAFVFKISQIKI